MNIFYVPVTTCQLGIKEIYNIDTYPNDDLVCQNIEAEFNFIKSRGVIENSRKVKEMI
jgi:hypothetical protein